MPDLDDAARAFLPRQGGIYLDCASQAPVLRAVHEAEQAALAACADAWQRGAPQPAPATERVRAQAARLFDADADALALVPSASYGIATAARNLPLQAGDAVLVLEGQFPSNLLAWQQACADRGARMLGVQRAPGQDWTTAVLDVLDRESRVRIVALPQVRWDDGALLDLDAIAGRVHAAGAALVLDLSQSLGVLPVELARWQPDFVASVGYKWLFGSRAMAWLWVAPRWREEGRAIEQHWSARSVEDWRFPVQAMPAQARGARRFDAGGLDDPRLLAVTAAGLDQVLAWRPARIAAALAELTHLLDEALSARGLAHWSTPGHAPHIAGIRPPARAWEAVSAAVQQAGIACTHRRGVLRVAPHLHVSAAQMQQLADVVAQAAARA